MSPLNLCKHTSVVKVIIDLDGPGPRTRPHYLPTPLNDYKCSSLFVFLTLMCINPKEPLRHVNIAFSESVFILLQLMVLRYHLPYQLVLVFHLVLYVFLCKVAKLIVLLFMLLKVKHRKWGQSQPE